MALIREGSNKFQSLRILILNLPQPFQKEQLCYEQISNKGTI